MPWKSWCSLCAKIPEDSSDFANLQGTKKLFAFAAKHFDFGRRRKYPVCVDCIGNLTTVQEYFQQCDQVQQMFLDFRTKQPQPKDEIQKLRGKWLTEVQEPSDIKDWIAEEELVQTTIEGTTFDIEVVFEKNPSVKEEEQQLVTHIEEVEEEEIKGEPDEEQESNSDEEGEFNEDEDEDEDEEEDSDHTNSTPQGKRKANRKSNSTHQQKQKMKSCKYCKRKFRKDWYLRMHERSHTHCAPGQLPYSCEICEKRCATISALQTHVTIHDEVPKFECDECGKLFKNRTRLNVHKEVHGDKKRICDICGLALKTSRSYNKHKAVHSDERKYKCPVCPKDFKKQTGLKEHIITHTNFRPYSCPFCKKTFVNGSSCRAHKVKVHPIENAQLEASGNYAEVTAKHRNLPTMMELLSKVQCT